MQRIRLHRRFLRAALMLVVALGVLLQPTLGALGQLAGLLSSTVLNMLVLPALYLRYGEFGGRAGAFDSQSQRA